MLPMGKFLIRNTEKERWRNPHLTCMQKRIMPPVCLLEGTIVITQLKAGSKV